MRKLFLIILLLLLAQLTMMAQNWTEKSSLFVSNSYLQKLEKGDGTNLFIGARFLFTGSREDPLKFGLSANWGRTISYLDGYIYKREEKFIGLAVNYIPLYWSLNNHYFFYADLGYKVGKEEGANYPYHRDQRDGSFFIFLGGEQKNDHLGWLYRNKLALMYQRPLSIGNTTEKVYENILTNSKKTDYEFLEFNLDNSIYPLSISGDEWLFVPHLLTGVNLRNDSRPNWQLGIGLTLNQVDCGDILSLQYLKITNTTERGLDIFRVNFDAVAGFKAIKKIIKNN